MDICLKENKMKDINFTFGINSDGSEDSCNFMRESIKSIEALKIPNYEIIIVGNADSMRNDFKNIRVLNFNENQRPKWITKKKNMITDFAIYDRIVYIHDYIKFDLDWYEGFKKFGDNFKVCTTKIKTINGERFRDWTLFPWHHCYDHDLAKEAKKLWEYSGIVNNECVLPYDELRLNKYQYLTGAYWVGEKSVMKEIPLDNNLLWDQGEDCDWSYRFIKKYNFSMNPHSTIHFMKWKQEALHPIKEECLKKCIEYVEKEGYKL